MPYKVSVPAFLFIGLLFILFTYSGVTYGASQLSADAIKERYTQAGCSGDPYPLLDTKQRHSAKGNPNSIVTPVPGRSPGLDVVFACRLTKLFEFMESQGCPITINSAQRNKQTCNPGGGACARQGNSCHQYGLAVDVGGNARCLQLVTTTIGRKNKNGRFGLHVAYVENGNYRHIQCVEHLVANASSAGGCRTSCDGKTRVNLDTSAGPDTASPSSPLANSLRDMLGLNKQPQQATPTPQQALPQSQQPTQYFPTSGTGQQTPTSGTPGQSPVSALSPASQQYLGVTQSDAQPQVSIADQLLQMAYGTTSTQQPQNTGTTVPVHLNSNDIGTMQSNHTVVTPSVGTQPTQNAPIGSLQPGQTFTSPDLGYAPSASQTYSTESTGVFRVLETMKGVLLRMLEILRPMGIRGALLNEHQDEYIE